jgi:hypothetical protein
VPTRDIQHAHDDSAPHKLRLLTTLKSPVVHQFAFNIAISPLTYSEETTGLELASKEALFTCMCSM